MATFKIEHIRHHVGELQRAFLEELHGRFARNVAIMIAAVMLFTSVVSYMEADASVQEEIGQRDSQAASLEGMTAQMYADQQMFHEGRVVVQHQSLRDRAIVERGLAQ